jgi:hypothetical protein
MTDFLDALYAGDSQSIRSPPSHERESAVESNVSLMYGEISDVGVRTLLTVMNVSKAKRVLDMGSGRGCVVLQAFLEWPHLTHVTGIEFNTMRASIASEALHRLHLSFQSEHANDPNVHSNIEESKCDSGLLTKLVQNNYSGVHPVERTLELINGNMLDIPPSYIESADIIIMQTNVLFACNESVTRVLERARKGTRLLTYRPITELYVESPRRWTTYWKWLEAKEVKVETSWSKSFRFRLYERTGVSFSIRSVS